MGICILTYRYLVLRLVLQVFSFRKKQNSLYDFFTNLRLVNIKKKFNFNKIFIAQNFNKDYSSALLYINKALQINLNYLQITVAKILIQ